MMRPEPPAGYEYETQQVTECDREGKPTIVLYKLRRSAADTRDPHQSLYAATIELANARDPQQASGALMDATTAQMRILQADDERKKAARNNCSKGGKARAEKLKTRPPMPAWMLDLFTRAHAFVEQDGKALVGHVALLGVAWRLAGPDHPDRDQLTEHRARQYLKIRPKSPR